MHLPTKARRALTALLLGAALVFATTAPALAGDGDTDGKDKDSTTQEMRVVVQRPGKTGETEVKVLRLKDGDWIPLDSKSIGVDGRQLHVPRVVTEFGHAPGGFAVFEGAPQAKSPLSSILRWLMQEGAGVHAQGDPMQAWFDGGADVPLAGLRDALKADGWNAQSMRTWFLQHLMGSMMQMHARTPAAHPAHAASRGPWFRAGRHGCDGHGQRDRCGSRGQGCGSCDSRGSCNSGRSSCGSRSCGQRSGCGSCDKRSGCGSCDKQSRCGSGSCGQRAGCGSCDKRSGCGSCDKKGMGRGARKAIMLFHDGKGWKHQVMDGPATKQGGMTFVATSGEDYPELGGILRELFASEGGTTSGSAQVILEGLELLPPDLLEQIPPDVLKGAMKELRGLGLGELLEPAKRGCGGDCDDCPNKGACKDGPEKADCCGTCKDECKDCPKAKSGECKGDCKDCPQKAAAK